MRFLSLTSLRSALAPLAVGAVIAAALAPSPALAIDSDEALADASRRVDGAVKQIPSIEQAIQRHQTQARSAEQRIADAVLLVGVKDYDRAIDLLEQIIEKYPNHATAFADAMNLLGEAYFQSRQYLSSRRIFMAVLDNADGRFAPYRERAAVRLVDVALRLKDFDSLDELYTKIANIQSAQSGLNYAKGKGMLAQGRLGAAATSLAAVGSDGEFAHQAKYLQGVVAMHEATPPKQEGEEVGEKQFAPKGRYAKAIQLFRDVTQMAPDTPEHRHVIDMAWLAIGRLLYESRQWTEAVEAYNRIDRTSPEFGTMLYELAWVYVQLGDVVRAQRALEVLAVAAPHSQDVADASLLRGDLLLRSGQFDKSKKVYESVRGTYEAMRERLDRFLGSTTDPSAYFDILSQDQLELFEAGRDLPAPVLKWAREGEDGERAFAIIDDVAMSRRLVKESNVMIERLNAVLSSPNRIRAMPALKVGAERALALVNSIAKARLLLGRGMDDVSDRLSPQLRQVRAQRKELEARLDLVPVTAGEFAGREQEAQRQWNTASQALQRLELEVDQLQATTNGLERMLADGPQAGVVRNPQQVQEFQRQLEEQRQLIRQYRAQIEELRSSVESGKVQVGFGDNRFVEDADVRRRFRQLLAQEVGLALQGHGGDNLTQYARRIQPVLQQGDQAEDRIEKALQEIEDAVAKKAAELREVVRRETANIVEYSLALEELDGEARMVVGAVAMRNFGQVRERLRDIVLRADVGVTEQAWELREEQYTRVRRLKIERARTEQRLREELEEVLDDSADPEAE
jgi:tetratricopeptide (TPR) repeat protein